MTSSIRFKSTSHSRFAACAAPPRWRRPPRRWRSPPDSLWQRPATQRPPASHPVAPAAARRLDRWRHHPSRRRGTHRLGRRRRRDERRGRRPGRKPLRGGHAGGAENRAGEPRRAESAENHLRPRNHRRQPDRRRAHPRRAGLCPRLRHQQVHVLLRAGGQSLERPDLRLLQVHAPAAADRQQQHEAADRGEPAQQHHADRPR